MGKNTKKSRNAATPSSKVKQNCTPKTKITPKRKSNTSSTKKTTPLQTNKIHKYLSKEEVVEDGIIGMKVRTPQHEKAS